MKKLLKFMSLLLIVPMLGIGSLLTGCGKDEASLQDVKDAYNKMIKAYHEESGESSKLSASENKLFSYNNDVELTSENTYNYFKDPNANVQFNIDFGYLDLDNYDGKINNANGDLRKRYYQIEEIYSKLLKYSNLYFERYQYEFFEVVGNEDLIDKEELYKLREKINNLESKLETFYANMLDREELAKFLGTNTEIMQTKINTFNSVYADLIEANFEFVLKFCDVHKSYILKDNEENQSSPAIVERTAYEAELKYAYGYFLYYVKSFQHNGLCNTFELSKNVEATVEETEYYTYVVYTNIKSVLSKDYKLTKDEKNAGLKTIFDKISFINEAEYNALSESEAAKWKKLEFNSSSIFIDGWLFFNGHREIEDMPSEYSEEFLADNESIKSDDPKCYITRHAFDQDKYDEFLNNELTLQTKKVEFVEKCLKVTKTKAEYDALDPVEQNYYTTTKVDIIPNEIFNKFIDEDGNARVFITKDTEGNIKLAEGAQLKVTYNTQLKQHIARFDSFTNLLKTNMTNFDIYTYTLVRIGSSEALYDAVEYDEILSDSEKAQKTMLDEYESYDLPLFAGAINLTLGIN